MPLCHAVRLLFLIACFGSLSVISAQEALDLDATYDDDNESFVFNYPSTWELTDSTDGFGVDLDGTVDDIAVTMSIESLPGDLVTEAPVQGERTTIFDTWANAYDLEDYEYIVLDDRDAVIGTVGTATNPITVIIIETNYVPLQLRWAVIFAVTDASDDDDTAQATILAVASTVIERDAESVLVAPTGLGGILSGGSETETPQNTIRDLTGDATEASNDDEEDSTGIGNVFSDDDDE